MSGIKMERVGIYNPDCVGVIIGQAHFCKSIPDLCEALSGSVPNIKYAVAFCEASGARLLRHEGNDEKLIELAKENGLLLSCGHSFIIFLDNAFPMHVLNSIKALPTVAHIFCATNNTVDVIVAETGLGRGIMGVVDGNTPVGVEESADKQDRQNLLKNLGLRMN